MPGGVKTGPTLQPDRARAAQSIGTVRIMLLFSASGRQHAFADIFKDALIFRKLAETCPYPQLRGARLTDFRLAVAGL